MTEARHPEAALAAAGGERWVHPGTGAVRFYWNGLPEMLGWRVHRYKTGNVSSAYLDGEKTSNGFATGVMGRLSMAKFWYEAADGEFRQKGLATDEEERVRAIVERRLEAAAWAVAESALPLWRLDFEPDPDWAPSFADREKPFSEQVRAATAREAEERARHYGHPGYRFVRAEKIADGTPGAGETA